MATVSMKKLQFWEHSTELSHMVTTMINSSIDSYRNHYKTMTFAFFKIIAPSAHVKQKNDIFSKKSLVFGDILHNNFNIWYILYNMKSSPCTQPFTEYV